MKKRLPRLDVEVVELAIPLGRSLTLLSLSLSTQVSFLTTKRLPLIYRYSRQLLPNRHSFVTMSNGHDTDLSASTGSTTVAPPNTSNQTLIPRLRPDDSYYIEVGPIGTVNPAVSRTLCVPAYLTFDQLHTVIQIAFDLRSDPYYQFNISHKGSWPDEVCTRIPHPAYPAPSDTVSSL